MLFRRISLKKTMAVFSSLLAFNASAQSNDEYHAPSSAFFITYGQLGVDDTLAKEEGGMDSGNPLKISLEGYKKRFVYAGGLGVTMYDSGTQFTRTVENINTGEIKQAESSVSVSSIFFEAGTFFPLIDNVYIDLLAGMDLVVSAQRSIGYCSNCGAEDIDFSSGFYFQPRLRFVNGGFTAAMGIPVYLSGDSTNGMLFSLGFAL